MTWFFIFLSIFWLAFFAYSYLRRTDYGRVQYKIADVLLAPAKLTKDDLLLLVYLPFLALWLYGIYPATAAAPGFGFGYLSLGLVASLLCYSLFAPRLRLLFANYADNGRLLQTYFQSPRTHKLFLLLSALFAVFFVTAQTKLAAEFLHTLSGGEIARSGAAIAALIIPILYLGINGLSGVLYIYRAQTLLLLLGFLLLALAVLWHFGGWSGLANQLLSPAQVHPAALARYTTAPTLDPSSYGNLAAALLIFNQDGGWTYLNLLSSALLFLGLPCVAFFFVNSSINQSAKDTGPRSYDGWPLLAGFCLLVVCLAPLVFLPSQLLPSPAVNPGDPAAMSPAYLPSLLLLITEQRGWLLPLLGFLLFSALQVAGICYLGNTAKLITADLLAPRLKLNAAPKQLRAFVAILGLLAGLALALSLGGAGSPLAFYGLAAAMAAQLLPALLGITYWPYLTRAGVNLGIIGGSAAVLLSGLLFPGLSGWPLGLHPAALGLAVNFIIAGAVSRFTQTAAEVAHKNRVHYFLRGHTGIARDKRHLILPLLLLSILWLLLVFGPLMLVGNFIFGDPANTATWLIAGLPSIWLWQLFGAATGLMLLVYNISLWKQ